MSFFKALLKQNLGLILLAGVLGIASGGISAQLIALVNQHLSKTGVHGWTDSGWFYLFLVALALFTGISTQVAITFLTEKLSLILREQLCRRVTSMSLFQIETIGGQRLTASLAQDIPAITTALMGIPVIVINSAILLGCLLYLGFLSWTTTLFLVGFIVFAMVTYQLPERFAVRHLEENRQQWNHFYRAFDALIDGTKELQLHQKRQKAFFKKHILATLGDLRKSALGFQLLYAVINHWSKLLYFVFIGLLLFVLAPQQGLDAKTLAGFIIIVLYLIAPVDSVIDIIPKFRAAVIAYQNMTRLNVAFEKKAELTTTQSESGPLPNQLPGEPADIHLHQVRYTFFRDSDSRPFTLGPLSFTIPAGEIVFIVGGNGSGKTTLAKILTGLYKPQSGSISYGQSKIHDTDLSSYRQNFSAVFNNFFLFDDLLGLNNKNLDQSARFYLEKLQLDHKVNIQEGQFSTTKLSTGQRKRLALLTAYLEDRPIYLFDEWAADQDPEFKKVFYENLLPELKRKGKTLLVISHDDRFFYLADKVLKLTDGQAEVVTISKPNQPSTGYSA